MFQHSGLLEHVLAPADYSSPEAYAREIDGLFRHHWHWVGRAAELRRPGDYLARDVLGTPVVVRNDGDGLVALENICPHRHCLVVNPGRGRARPLRCQYHGWEFGGDGRVARIPDGRSFRGLRAEGLCLRRLRLELLAGMVFVNLGDEGEGFAAGLGEMAGEIERFFGDHRLVWEWTTEHDVNWKVIAENAVESYHVPMRHPGTFRDYRPPELHDHRLEKRYTSYRDLKPWGRRPLDRGMTRLARLLLPHPTFERFRQTHVFPNYLLYYGELFSTFIVLEPLGPERTRHVQLGFAPRRIRRPLLTRPLQALATRALVAGVRRVMREDMRVWPDIHHGLAHSGRTGVLSRREERVFAFQKHVHACRGTGRDRPR